MAATSLAVVPKRHSLVDYLGDDYPGDRLKAFREYSSFRAPDARAIADLALGNYIEVSHEVNSNFSNHHTSFSS